MQNNLASVAASLESMIAGIERAVRGELASAVSVSMAERGAELLTDMFATTTSPSGVPWAPPARNYGHPLLHASGDLESSGTCEVGPRDDAGGFDLTFAFTDPKAPWHQFGTKRGGGRALSYGGAATGARRKSGADGSGERYHIPARPLLPVVGDHGRWRDDLEEVGQRAAERWLTVNVRI